MPRPYRFLRPEEEAQETVTRVEGTDQYIRHWCTWDCPGPQIRTYTQELFAEDGTPQLWYFAECSACETIGGYSPPAAPEAEG